MELTSKVPAFFVSTEKFCNLLGPFWIYLLAIMLHMTAAVLMCLMGVNKRLLFLHPSEVEKNNSRVY